MRHLLWSVLGVSTLMSACDSSSLTEVRINSTATSNDRSILRVVEALQCPQAEGVLTRVGSANVDGQSCTYAGPRGTEVELKLISLSNQSAADILMQIENQLSADLPEATQALTAPSSASKNIEAIQQDGTETSRNDSVITAAAPIPNPDPTLADDRSSQVQVRMPGLSVDSEGDRSTVRLPGMRIESDGDQSVVRIGGIVIRSDSREGSSQISLPASPDSSSETVSVDANKQASRIRAVAPGEAIRASFKMQLNQARNTHWRAVGYEARGPMGGPIVVATFRSRDDNNDRVLDGAKALVTLNVGK